MANIIGLVTVNNKQVIEVDNIPSNGAGTPSPIGSLALYDSGTIGTMYLKTGTADTAWSKVDTSDNDWALDGNALTGALSSSPDQFFGSTNDYDLIFKRNNVEAARFAAQSFLLGLNASAGGRLQVQASNQGDQIFRQQTLSNDSTANIARVSVQRKIHTTDNTLTTIADIALPTDTVMMLEATVVARQTGGTSGAAGDGAAFVREVHARNNAGVVSIRKEQTSFTSRDRAGFDLNLSVSTTNIRYQVKGENDRNLAWNIHYEFMLAVD